MTTMYEEIAHRETSIGQLVLRRRRQRRDGPDIWEILLDDGYLMSSQFVDGEIALATLALAMIESDDLNIVVGGLGLGYTAKAVLDDCRVSRLSVIELIPEVIEWHRQGALPLGPEIAGSPRCDLVKGDFFSMARDGASLSNLNPEHPLDAILIDIDHSTTHLIDTDSAAFYQTDAIRAASSQLRSGGIFGLWSSGAEEPGFMQSMKACLEDVRAERVEFFNPYRDEPASNIIYLGRRN